MALRHTFPIAIKIVCVCDLQNLEMKPSNFPAYSIKNEKKNKIKISQKKYVDYFS